MLSKEDRVSIKMLRVEKGYGAKRLMAEFPRRNWSLDAVKRLLQKIDATAKPAVVDVALRALTGMSMLSSKVKVYLYETM